MSPVRAVVLDIGSVLEVIDDSVFPRPFLSRHGLPTDAFAARVRALPGDGMVGGLSECDIRRHWQAELELTHSQADELVADFWRWYVGTPDQPLFDWFAGLRGRGLTTGILSNSAPGAREAERGHGFENITDDIVYSHEVGLAKPDPAVYELTARRLAVRPEEIAFLDDHAPHVAAARAAGWHAVLHRDAATSIAAIEELLG
ncbi:HAD-IA family hydrolase [Nocardioides sp. LHG3406-4]|uniref:HAD-IA family hydrolase n=1 Tax=Nocardioides sp. LHG3406-4 TaxID=2804575 RepID=UPI003CFAA574